jgi:hypothetical protein
MTGPEHYRKAQQLAAEADKHLGQGEGQDTAAAWAAAAQVHATLALAAATALAPSGADHQAWIKAAGPEPSPRLKAPTLPRKPGPNRGHAVPEVPYPKQ